MQLLVLADDLTGAMDTGVQFAMRGAATAVAVRADGPALQALAPCEVLCLNTESRHSTPAAALEQTMALLARFAPVPHVYLKTDSALRGNLSAVFQGAWRRLGAPVHFAPAYPAAGRTTRGGVQYVKGLPLECSCFAQDPLNPMKTGLMAEILAADYPLRCEVHGIGTLAFAGGDMAGLKLETAGPQPGTAGPHVEAAGAPIPAGPAQVHIYDAETDRDLQAVGEGLARRGLLGLTAGCAGFAGVLAKRLAFAEGPPAWQPVDRPVLYLSGSANAATFEQLAQARRQGMAVVTIPAEMKTAPGGPGAAALDALADELKATLARGRSALLATAQGPEDLAAGGEALHAGVAAVFARVAGRLAGGVLGGLALFGGDTAQAVLEALGIHTLWPILEVEPGVPLCRPGGGPVPALVTKSGGLGGPGAVAAIERCLRRGSP